MARYLSWLANAALLVVCCALVASTANAVFAALLTPEPATAALDARNAPTLAARSWSARQVILDRNLFNASLLAPASRPLVVEEDLEETKLALALLGTFASPDPDIARAAVDDQESRKHVVLKVGDEIQGGRARLIRIERRRIVLEENGTLRELTFDDSLPDAKTSRVTKTSRRTSRKSTSSRRRSSRRRQLQPAAQEASPDAGERAMRSPADIFSEARILPKWENGRMVGVQVSGIKRGSLFEEIGVSNGEIITQLNGIAIDSPEASAEVMLELTEADTFEVTIEGPNGPRTINVPVNR